MHPVCVNCVVLIFDVGSNLKDWWYEEPDVELLDMQ